jgi:hypothetical protein
MTLKELMQYNTDNLNEGVRFFKESKKIKKLRKKISDKMDGLEEEEKKDLQEFLDKTEEIASKFENIEKDFKKAKSSEVKKKVIQQHKKLKNEFKELFVKDKEDILKTIFKIGLGAIVIKIIVSLFTKYTMPDASISDGLDIDLTQRATMSARSGALQNKTLENLSAARNAGTNEVNKITDDLIKRFGSENIDRGMLSNLQKEVRQEAYNNFWYNRDNW